MNKILDFEKIKKEDQKKYIELIKYILNKDINSIHIDNLIILKMFTKLVNLFYYEKIINLTNNELYNLLQLHLKGGKSSTNNLKLQSHFYGHAGTTAKIIFFNTYNLEYAEKSKKYYQLALTKYKNDKNYEIMINKNIIKLGINVIRYTSNENIQKKWKKLIKNKIRKVLKDEDTNKEYLKEYKELLNIVDYIK